jgi:GNAT superfamily N-acetyltransferase
VRRAERRTPPLISSLHAALQDYHAAAHPDFFKPSAADTFPPAMVRDHLAQPGVVIFLAEIDGAAVGYLYADANPAQETSMTYRLERLWIHHIGVAPAHQRQGAGAALIDAAKQHAQQPGHLDAGIECVGVQPLGDWLLHAAGLCGVQPPDVAASAGSVAFN